MFNMLFLLVSLSVMSTACAEQISVLKSPSYFKFEQRDERLGLSGHDFSTFVKGISGLLPSGEAPNNFQVTMLSGLKAPKLFVFLHLASNAPLSQTPVPAFDVQPSNPVDLKALFTDISDFYGKNANLISMDRGENLDLHEIFELIKTVKQTSQQGGPLFLSTPLITATAGIDQPLDEFLKNLVSLYGDDFCVFGLVTPVAHSERVRRAAASGGQDGQMTASVNALPSKTDINVGKDYSEIYPVIFNIILWFMIAMGITIASVAYCIWFMDPGKDGIIYRMTASRIKKDL